MVQGIEPDVEQATIFLRGIAFFKSNEYAMQFWQEKMAHRFPLYRWNGRYLQRINDIQETQDNPTTT